MTDCIIAASIYSGMTIMVGSVRYRVLTTLVIPNNHIKFGLVFNGLKAELIVKASDEICIVREN